MKHNFYRAALLGFFIHVMSALDARADAYAASLLTFTNLSVSSAGTFQLLGDWQASAFAQAGVNNQYNSGLIASSTASGDFSTAGGTAVGASPAPAW